MAGEPLVNRDSLPPGFAVLPGQPGYDGQYYYRLARDPFTGQRTAFGVTLDRPAYRQQRILYPMLVRFASMGRVGVIPFAMVAVNFAALCLMGWLGGLLARDLGRHALWGAVFPLYIGFVTTLSRDLTEIVECTLLVAAALALRRSRFPAAALLLSAAVLSKEPALLAPAAVGLADLVGDRPRLRAHTWYVAGLPLAVYALWQVWLHYHWGPAPFQPGAGNIGWPLVGFGRAVTGAFRHWHWPWVLGFALIPVAMSGVVMSLRTTRAERWERYAWALYGLLVFTLTTAVWEDSHAFVRAASELTLLAGIILLGSEGRWRNWVLGLGLVCWAGAAVQVGLRP
jgi:hypothetical protein